MSIRRSPRRKAINAEFSGVCGSAHARRSRTVSRRQGRHRANAGPPKTVEWQRQENVRRNVHAKSRKNARAHLHGAEGADGAAPFGSLEQTQSRAPALHRGVATARRQRQAFCPWRILRCARGNKSRSVNLNARPSWLVARAGKKVQMRPNNPCIPRDLCRVTRRGCGANVAAARSLEDFYAPLEHVPFKSKQPLFTSPLRGEVGMRGLAARIPGEGVPDYQ